MQVRGRAGSCLLVLLPFLPLILPLLGFRYIFPFYLWSVGWGGSSLVLELLLGRRRGHAKSCECEGDWAPRGVAVLLPWC